MEMEDNNNGRWRDLDKLLLRSSKVVGEGFDPKENENWIDDLKEYCPVLVVGAGGLGCELLKDLALSGFMNLEVIDMDTIDVSNLNRQFLFRMEDVGKSKAEVAAKRVMERVSGVNIVPHFCRIEDKDLDFYENFSIIALGLDSLEARRHINTVACSFLEYDSDDKPCEGTIKPMVDAGTQGFMGHFRVIIPGKTPCFECLSWMFPRQLKFPLCTLAETPRTPAHCIEYVHLIRWDQEHPGKCFDADDPEHIQWVYSQALERAQMFGISGVTYSLTQGVVKNIVPAIASTNAISAAACALEALKIVTGCSRYIQKYVTYNGADGTNLQVVHADRMEDCLVCGPGVLMELETSVTLQKFIDLVREDPRLQLTRTSVMHRGNNLYIRAPRVLEEETRPNLDCSLFQLVGEVAKATVHLSGTISIDDTRSSVSKKVTVSFKGVADGVTDMDTTGEA